MAETPKVSIDKTEAQFIIDNATYLETVAVLETITPESQNSETGLFQTIQGRLASAFVNVIEFGVLGSGDDTAALTAALISGGAAVYFIPPGSYTVTTDIPVSDGSIVLAPGVTLTGGVLTGAITVLGIDDVGGTGVFLNGEGDFTAVPAPSIAHSATTGQTEDDHHNRQHSVTDAADHTFPGGGTTFLRDDGTFAIPAAGDVTGPGSTTPGLLAYWDDASGDLLGQSPGVQHGQVVIKDGTRSFTGTIVGVTPTLSTHLATRGYVDAPGITAYSGAIATMNLNQVTKATIDGNATNITILSGTFTGQEVTILATGTRTFEHSANLVLSGSANFDMVAGDSLRVMDNGSEHQEIGRSLA